MFELAWTELLVIGLIVLIVVGPKDLPNVLRTTGKWVRRAQHLAREFQGSLEDMAREAELDEARKTVESAAGFNVRRTVEDAIDPDKEMAKDLSIPRWGDAAEDDDDDPTGSHDRPAATARKPDGAGPAGGGSIGQSAKPEGETKPAEGAAPESTAEMPPMRQELAGDGLAACPAPSAADQGQSLRTRLDDTAVAGGPAALSGTAGETATTDIGRRTS